MLLRDQGKLAFATLREGGGDEIQLFALSKVLDGFDEFVKLNLGDWIGATGEVVRTRGASCRSRSVVRACWPRPAGASATSSTASPTPTSATASATPTCGPTPRRPTALRNALARS